MFALEFYYYGLICLSVVMFGGCFALNDVYRKMRGSNLKISMQFSLVSGVAGLIIMLIINGLKFEFTPFALIMSTLTAINGFAFTFCAFKALGSINLSLYSLFSMLGGMVLPFLQGIIFYSEPITLAKGVCFVIICVALLLTVEKSDEDKENKKNGFIYYAGIFVLNGMSGVISKFFTSAPDDWGKTSPEAFSILSAVVAIIISAVALLCMRKVEAPKMTWASAGVSAVGGITNKIANYVLLIALAHVPASVQYPMVTGGVMIVSTVICFFGKNKPKPKELVSVALAFIGILALVLIPI